MYVFTKVFWLSCSCLVLANLAGSSVIGDILEQGFWKNINTACTAAAGKVEPVLSKDDVKYLSLIEYTPFSYQRHKLNSAVDALMESKNFRNNRKTVIFMHGFIDNPLLFSGQAFAIAYDAHGHTNVLALDSSKLIGMFYLRSSILVKYIGTALGHFLSDLVDRGMDVENIHLVGHSLGAHIAGFAGKAFKKLRPGSQLPRITGLDPAGPCFTNLPAEKRLDKEDARFVDAIHTNVGDYGINEAIGHVDFFPNAGGPQQPNCKGSICSHNTVWMFYGESVFRPEGFMAIQCNSWDSFKNGHCSDNGRVPMGFATPNTTRGSYYLRTKSWAPFGLGSIGAKPKMADKMKNWFNIG